MSGTSTDRTAPQELDTVWTERTSILSRIPHPLPMLAVFVVALLSWELVYRLELVPNIILPSPGQVGAALVEVGRSLVTIGYVGEALLITAQEVLLGFCIAVAIGFFLGLLVGETKFGERALMPYLVAFNTMPKVAFAPLFVAWLGFGISSKIALAAFVSFFPIVVATVTGLHTADENARMLFRMIGASRLQTLIKLKLPAGMPSFFAGLKISATMAVVGAVLGEFIGGGKGMGELIKLASSILDTAGVFALITYLSLLGVFMFSMVSWIQRRLIFWHSERISAGTDATP